MSWRTKVRTNGMLLATCCGAPVSAWLKNTPGLSGLLLGVKQLLVHS
jgi:hypothetical protein